MTVSGGDEFPDAFYGQEGRMAFIAMPDRGIDAQGAQDPYAADPEQKFLTEPDFLVSTVEPRGEGTILGRILRHIGIDEIEGHSSVTYLPHQHRNLAVADLDLDGAGDPRRRHRLVNRRIVSIEGGVGGFLPSFRVDTLLEISLRVHEADTDERNAQVTGLFAMVSGQDAKSSAVNRDGNMQPELSRKAEYCRAKFGSPAKVAKRSGFTPESS
jgi:hypothetical protein